VTPALRMWQIARMPLPQGQFENLLAEPIAGCGMEGTLAQVAMRWGFDELQEALGGPDE
jgi:hypothetical protein